jgi:hypothetical protein
MTKPYKLPICWLHQQISSEGNFRLGTMEDINPDCTCTNPMQAFMCAEGHLTECHKGMNCEEAECSHLAQYDEEGDPGSGENEDGG